MELRFIMLNMKDQARFKIKCLYAVLFLLLTTSCAHIKESVQNNKVEPWQYLLDSQLSQWEIWMGVPHKSVKGLPVGTFVSDNLNVDGDTKDAMGLNKDVKNVFSMTSENGEPVLHISGEIYGGLTTLASFENYHLSLQVKWGDKKWAPRLKAKRDSGLLFHCQGDHGAFWKVWKACHELQIQETDFGDYIPLAGPSAMIRGSVPENGKKLKYNPTEQLHLANGYVDAYIEPDYSNGQWNTVELYALADDAVFVVNGKVVMVIEQSKNQAGNMLGKGQLQLQSEGAELFYKDIKIKSITALPETVTIESSMK
jgi:hypothetical protein